MVGHEQRGGARKLEGGCPFGLRDRRLQWERSEFAAERGEKKGWPCSVVPYLDANGGSGGHSRKLVAPASRFLLDVAVAPQDLPSGVEDRRAAGAPFQRVRPALQDGIPRFHP